MVATLLAIAAGEEVGCGGFGVVEQGGITAEGLAGAGKGDDYVAVTVVGRANSRGIAVLQVDRECFFRFEDFQEIVHKAGIKRDRDLRAIVSNWELDARLTDFGSLAGEHERAIAEREVDATAFFA